MNSPISKGNFMHNSNTTKQRPSLLTVKLFAAKHPAFTKSILRSWVFYRTENGFDQCIVRIGRKLLINEASVFEWIDRQNEESKQAGSE